MTQPVHDEGGDDGARRNEEADFDITVIIVSWNVAGVLKDCLDSLARDRGVLRLEVLVVDNASSDNTLEMLRTGYPWVQVIANRENRGFARANNQGIALARGRLVLLLNPDTILSEGALRTLSDFLMNHPAAGAIGPNLRHPSGKPDSGSAPHLQPGGCAFHRCVAPRGGAVDWTKSLSTARGALRLHYDATCRGNLRRCDPGKTRNPSIPERIW